MGRHPATAPDGRPVQVHVLEWFQLPRGSREPRKALSERLGISVQAIARYIHQFEYRKANRLPLLGRDIASAIRHPRYDGVRNLSSVTRDPTKAPEELLSLAATSSALTPDQRRQILSTLATTSPGPVTVSAIRALEEMDRAQGQNSGIPGPTTPAEAITRLGRILLAVAPQTLTAALKWAEDERAKIIAPDPGTPADEGAPVPPSPTPG